MTKKAQQATKAQAQAVRDYLQTLGFELTHVQALEVIARGQGLRSRHNLADRIKVVDQRQTPSEWVDANVNGNPRLIQAMKNQAEAAERAAVVGGVKPNQLRYTRVCYAYVDGSNCKRFSAMVFRGRLTKEQLRFIAHKLDEGLYFVPCQVGIESLHLTFTDDGGDDHYWHKLEIGSEEDWVLDSDGFVLSAGDVRQIEAQYARDFATDADCDNLFWRFARIQKWDPELQEAVLTRHAYQRVPGSGADFSDIDVGRLAQQWKSEPALKAVPLTLLTQVAQRVFEEGFLPFPGVPREVRRPVGPNAYQFCILDACEPEFGQLALNFDVSTQQGAYLTETPVLALDQDNAQDRLTVFSKQAKGQLQACRVIPAAYDGSFT